MGTVRLVVISHTPHHQHDGEVRAWGPTVRELDELATIVDELVHVAPVHDGDALAVDRPYRARNIRFVAVEPAGGTAWVEKLAAIRRVPSWVRTIRRELRSADAAHVRLPANIAYIGLVVLMVRRKPAVRWFKYAGAWDDADQPLLFKLQRWSLRRLSRLHRGVVSIAGSSEPQASHVVTLRNPALTRHELECGRRRDDAPTGAVRLLYVGRLEPRKGAEASMRVAELLAERGMEVRLDIVGDGSMRDGIARSLRPAPTMEVALHGWLAREDLNELYRVSHVVLHPSSSEGFPKVLAEGMAFGAVPVASCTGSTQVVLSQLGVGVVVDDSTPEAYALAVEELVRHPEDWSTASEAARRAASEFTYDAYRAAVAPILGRARR